MNNTIEKQRVDDQFDLIVMPGILVFGSIMTSALAAVAWGLHSYIFAVGAAIMLVATSVNSFHYYRLKKRLNSHGGCDE